jgi:hypothetical protein
MLTTFRCRPSAEVCNRLLARVAARDPIAFRSLYHRLGRRVFQQAREGLGDTASAVAVTKAVFVEVWRLAPVSGARHRDAIGWVTAITARRVAERIESGVPRSILSGHDDHMERELAAVLNADRISFL